jgi:hypothetical protein
MLFARRSEKGKSCIASRVAIKQDLPTTRIQQRERESKMILTNCLHTKAICEQKEGVGREQSIILPMRMSNSALGTSMNSSQSLGLVQTDALSTESTHLGITNREMFGGQQDSNKLKTGFLEITGSVKW